MRTSHPKPRHPSATQAGPSDPAGAQDGTAGPPQAVQPHFALAHPHPVFQPVAPADILSLGPAGVVPVLDDQAPLQLYRAQATTGRSQWQHPGLAAMPAPLLRAPPAHSPGLAGPIHAV